MTSMAYILDYIRYPETWKINISHDAARQNITGIVRAIGNKVKAAKPWVKYSCSPIGKYNDLSRFGSNGWNAYAKVCQDAQAWLRDGLMDALYPMMYFQGNNFLSLRNRLGRAKSRQNGGAWIGHLLYVA